MAELLEDYTDGSVTFKKGELAGIVKRTEWQIVLLFLDGKMRVLSPKQVKVLS